MTHAYFIVLVLYWTEIIGVWQQRGNYLLTLDRNSKFRPEALSTEFSIKAKYQNVRKVVRLKGNFPGVEHFERHLYFGFVI